MSILSLSKKEKKKNFPHRERFFFYYRRFEMVYETQPPLAASFAETEKKVTFYDTDSLRSSEELDTEYGESLDEVYDIVDAVVSRTDDPNLPALTFRVWFLGIIFGVALAFVNTLFTFRTNIFVLSPFIGVLLSYPAGVLMSKILPTTPIAGFTLNPGRFNQKEHALIFVFCSACTSPAYALYNIIGQKYQLYQSGLTTIACLAFGIATQCFGYGLAGLCRRYLVRPAAMLWPGNLSTIAMLNSLHGNDGADDPSLKTSRFTFFWASTAIMALYQFLPSFLAPVLTAVSLLCYFAPKLSNDSSVPSSYTAKVMRGLGSAQPGGGIGFLSLTFDWSIIGIMAPITTPLWAMLNQFLGVYLILYIITPILWTSNAFGNDFSIGADPRDGPNGTGRFPLGFALNTPALFDRDGKMVTSRSFIDRTTLTLNETFYDSKKPVHITTYFAVEYAVSFVVFTSALVHVALWYGADIWRRFRTAVRDLDRNDVHAKMMDVYPDVPDMWYIIILAFNFCLAVLVCQFGGFDLPWWGVVLGFVLALVTMIPIGTIQAISGQQIGLNVMSEFLIGLILPGRMAAVMTFKTFSYMAMSQGLFLVQDLKLGHYVKIPPRAMFTVQLFSTILSVIINIFVSFSIYESFGKSDTEYVIPGDSTSGNIWKLQSIDPPVGWNANNYNVFLNAGTIWGGIGPARFFGPESPYHGTLWGFLAGFILPIIPWMMHRFQPDGYWYLVNIPLIAVFPVQAGGTRSDLVTPLIVGLVVNYFVKKYNHAWWRKYAYVMSAGFDAGSAITVTICFLAFTLNSTYVIQMPYYALHFSDMEGCAPSYFTTCKGNRDYGSLFGKTYNISEDEYCNSIGFGGLSQ